MPVNRELVGSPWPKDMNGNELREALAKRNQQKKEPVGELKIKEENEEKGEK